MKTEKAYNNLDFLNSKDARTVRILSEFLEPRSRFRDQKIKDTIVVFGSAKVRSRREAKQRLKNLLKEKASRAQIRQAEMNLQMSRYYEDTVKLTKLLTSWSLTLQPKHRFVICSGGGPGIMEAANLGAKRAGGKSIGLNISLSDEQFCNKYVTPGLGFEFHYFFMRKFWFAYLAKALVIMPGGYGTLDELFEILTLVQTKKMKKKLPIVIYDREFWNKVMDLNELLRKDMIDKQDMKLCRITGTVEETYEFLREELSRNYIDIETSLLNKKE